MSIEQSVPVADREGIATHPGATDGPATESPFDMDSGGQMEIKDIDTPLGKKADEFIGAVARHKAAENEKGTIEVELIELMKEAGLRTITYKGERIRFTPGHQTPDKLKFVATNA